MLDTSTLPGEAEGATGRVGFMNIRLPNPSLVLLVGPSASGKSTWASTQFREGQVLSSDHLRAVVGHSSRDQRASTRAFELLDQLILERLDRGLLTVVDSMALDGEQRARHIRMARDRGLPVFGIAFDTDAKVCRDRNTARGRPVPVGVHTQQLKRWPTVRDELDDDGFDQVWLGDPPGSVHVVPASLWTAPAAAAEQKLHPSRLRFDLNLARFPWETDEIGPMVAAVARRAEDVGFDTLWVMDHLRQIPQVGAAWDPLPEAYTTLAYAAGVTERINLGTMVTAVTYRNVGLLAKMIATLDVLSGGRARCGIGAGWFEAEAVGYGYEWESDGTRLDLLEDALQALPLVWGPGNKPFSGTVMSIPETMCYPRPIQDPIPILVGGGGEKRTLRLVAEYASGSNLFGPPEAVAHKIGVLARHCDDVGRALDEIDVSVLTTAVTAEDADRLGARLSAMGDQGDPETLASTIGAAVVDDQIGRFRSYADVGVNTIVLAVADLAGPDDLEPYRAIIDAFR